MNTISFIVLLAKTSSPMSVTVAGMTILLKEVQYSNTHSSILSKVGFAHNPRSQEPGVRSQESGARIIVEILRISFF